MTLYGQSLGDDFGSAIAVGDLNGDGYDDIIVGAYRNGSDTGRVYIYFGGPGGPKRTPDIVLSGFAAGERFGVSLASGSDINGDGYEDLLVGAYLNSARGAFAGRTYLFFGGPKIGPYPDRVYTGQKAGDNFGISVAMGGDINGDGFGDFLIGAGGDGSATHIGKAYLYYGGFNPGVTADLTMNGNSPGDSFGRMVKIIKDTDGDGFTDFLVGAPNHADPSGLIPSSGEAYLYFGGPNLKATPGMKLTNPVKATNAQFGFSGTAIGDIYNPLLGTASKDGYSDWVIGAWGGTQTGSLIYPGWAGVYYGTATGPNGPLKIYSLNSVSNESFGVAISSPGDFNGDGFPDLIVGAMHFNASDGAAYFYDGKMPLKPSPDAGLFGVTGSRSGFGFDVH